MAAKIRRKRTFNAALGQDDLSHHVQVALNVGAPKGVNRLLRVSDHEDFTWLDLDRLPLGGALAEFFRQVEENLVLNRIGILKFIDENGLEKILEFFA